VIHGPDSYPQRPDPGNPGIVTFGRPAQSLKNANGITTTAMLAELSMKFVAGLPSMPTPNYGSFAWRRTDRFSNFLNHLSARGDSSRKGRFFFSKNLFPAFPQ
jgi:hypothetical protein